MATGTKKKKSKKKVSKRNKNAFISIDTHDFSFWESAKLLGVTGLAVGTGVLVTEGIYNKVTNYAKGILEDEPPQPGKDNVVNIKNSKVG